MNGKQAKKLRRKAEIQTKGEWKSVTRKAYKILKSEYKNGK